MGISILMFFYWAFCVIRYWVLERNDYNLSMGGRHFYVSEAVNVDLVDFLQNLLVLKQLKLLWIKYLSCSRYAFDTNLKFGHKVKFCGFLYCLNSVMYKKFYLPLRFYLIKGEGVVEFANKHHAMEAISACRDSPFILTSSLIPVIVEPYEVQFRSA